VLPELTGLEARQDVEPVTARDVREVRFSVVRRGYDLAEVDTVLRRVAAALPAVPEPPVPSWDADPVPPALAPGPGLRAALRGYRRDDVDAFLVRCAHSLGASVAEVPELAALTGRPRVGLPLSAPEVESAQFPMVWGGYASDPVDALLDRVQALLRG
jgi:DivIVA domain-containing protein